MRFFRVRKVAARSRVKLCLLVLISERRECERERKTSFSRNYDASSLEEEEEEEAVVVGSIFPMRLIVGPLVHKELIFFNAFFISRSLDVIDVSIWQCR